MLISIIIISIIIIIMISMIIIIIVIIHNSSSSSSSSSSRCSSSSIENRMVVGCVLYAKQQQTVCSVAVVYACVPVVLRGRGFENAVHFWRTLQHQAAKNYTSQITMRQKNQPYTGATQRDPTPSNHIQ